MADQKQILLSLSAQIVAAHVGHNDTESTILPDVIKSVYNALVALQPEPAIGSNIPIHAHTEPVPCRHDHAEHRYGDVSNAYAHPTFGQTVFGDRLICMEDGLSMKMLRRHLLTVHGLTPDEYRAKWGLPESYPMVAREYAALRSSLALASGLGLKSEDRLSKARKGHGG